MDMGYSVFVMRDSSAEGNAAPQGIFGWSGYHNTHFWIDPSNQMYVLWMSRAREFSFEIPRACGKLSTALPNEHSRLSEKHANSSFGS